MLPFLCFLLFTFLLSLPDVNRVGKKTEENDD